MNESKRKYSTESKIKSNLGDSSVDEVGLGRIHLIDEIRGFCIILVVVFHAFITFGYTFKNPIATYLYQFFYPAQPFFAGLFILICGLSCRLSRNNLKRGFTLAAISAFITLFTYFITPELVIWFGILHFLSIAILLFSAFEKPLNKIPPIAGIVIFLLLFILSYNIPPPASFIGIKGLFTIDIPQSWVKIKLLFPLGFSYIKTSDYFPIIPWIFCFLSGSFIGVWAKNGQFPKWTYKSRIPFLSWVGKHTLIIYIAHQPIIFGIAMLFGMNK